MRPYESFNQSGFSKFLNNTGGRIFRLAAGMAFLAVGFMYRDHALGLLSMAWGVLPLSAGVFDICYVSALLGGPLSGTKIRSQQLQGVERVH
jgi:hypothetical protein